MFGPSAAAESSGYICRGCEHQSRLSVVTTRSRDYPYDSKCRFGSVFFCLIYISSFNDSVFDFFQRKNILFSFCQWTCHLILSFIWSFGVSSAFCPATRTKPGPGGVHVNCTANTYKSQGPPFRRIIFSTSVYVIIALCTTNVETPRLLPPKQTAWILVDFRAI